MTAKTHILGGIFAGELVSVAGGIAITSVPVLLAGAAAGALVPDIDHRGSKISRSSAAGSITSFLLLALTTHRGAIHTPVFVLFCGLVLGALSFFSSGLIGPVLLEGLLIGMLSHLILDTLNPGGIMWLWPISRKKFHLTSIKTNSLGEWVCASALLAAVVWTANAFLPGIVDELEKLLPV